MVFKKYTYKNGKRFGPYYYENKRVNGKIVTRYLGSSLPAKNRRGNTNSDTRGVMDYSKDARSGARDFSVDGRNARGWGEMRGGSPTRIARRDLIKKVGERKFERVFGKGFRRIDEVKLSGKSDSEKRKEFNKNELNKLDNKKYSDKEHNVDKGFVDGGYDKVDSVQNNISRVSGDVNFSVGRKIFFVNFLIVMVAVFALIVFLFLIFNVAELGVSEFDVDSERFVGGEEKVVDNMEERILFDSGEEDVEIGGEEVVSGEILEREDGGFFDRVGGFIRGIFGFGEEEFEIEGEEILLAPSCPVCGSTISANTELTCDMSCSTTSALTIGTSNVVLDCQGHKITCTDQQCDGILVNGANNVQIRNCVIENTATTPFSDAALIEVRNSNGLIVDNVQSVSTSKSTGIYLVSMDATGRIVTVRNSNFNDATISMKNVLFERTIGGGVDGFSYYDLILEDTDVGALPPISSISNGDVDFGTNGNRKIIRKWTLTVGVYDDPAFTVPLSGASFSIDDSNAGTANPVSFGTTNAAGQVVTNPLPETERSVVGAATSQTEVTYNPYLVDITKTAYDPIVDSPVTMDAKKTNTYFLSVDTTISACPFTISIPGKNYIIDSPTGIAFSGTCITISASDVNLSGSDGMGGRREIRHSLDSAGYGISIGSGFNNIDIRDIRIVDDVDALTGMTTAGVNSLDNNNLRVSNVEFVLPRPTTSYGVWAIAPTAEKSVNISNNIFSINHNNADGVRLEGDIAGNVSGNSFTSAGNAGNAIGIHLVRQSTTGTIPDGMNISGNIINICNGCLSNYGIFVEDGNGQTISSNTITQLSGAITVSESRGIYLKTDNNVLSGNTITTARANSHGVFLETAANNVFTNEDITTSGATAHGTYVSSNSFSNRFIDSFINVNTAGGAKEIFFDAVNTAQTWNNNFTNVRRGNAAAPALITGNPAGFATGPPASTGRLNMHYYVDANVNFAAAGSHSGIKIDCVGANSGTCFSDVAIDASGNIPRQEVLASKFEVGGETSYDAHNFSVDNGNYVQGVNEWGDDLESRNLSALGNLIGAQRLEFVLREAGKPSIVFVPPTPADASTLTANNFIVEALTTDVSEHYTFLDFDNNPATSAFESSLKFWLRMDDFNATGSLIDISATGLGNKSFDDVAFGSGRYGNAVIFDGTDDVGTDGIADMLKFEDVNKIILDQNEPSGFTGAAWVRIDPSLTGSQIFWVLGQDFEMKYATHAEPEQQRLYCIIRKADETQIGLQGQPIPVANIADGQWRHYVCKFDPDTNFLTWYINGVKQQDVDASEFDRFPTSSLNTLLIGGNGAPIASAGEYMEGSVDEVLIFDRALSDAEVISLYKNATSSPSNYSQLFSGLTDGEYRFDVHSVDVFANRGTATRTVTIDIPPFAIFDDETTFDAIDTVGDGVTVPTVTEPYFDIGTFIEVLSGTNLNSVDFFWNTEKRTLFNTSTSLLLNMNNVPAIGEDYSKTLCSDLITFCKVDGDCGVGTDGCRIRIFDVSGKENNGGYFGDNEDPIGSMLSALGLGNFNPANCVDGIITTGALPCFGSSSSPPPDPWLKIDLGAGNEKDYVKAKMYVENVANGYHFTEYNIQYSDDDSIYVNVATGFNPRIPGQWHEAAWGNVGKHRYWRFYVASGIGDWGNIMEIEMHVDKTNGGRYGAGFEFDGIDDYINLGVSPTLNTGITDITISAWVKLDAEIGSAGTNYEIFTNEFFENYGYIFRIQNSDSGGSSRGTIYLRFSRAGAGAYSELKTPIDTYPNDKQWHHVVGVKSGIDAYIYLDGVLVANAGGILPPTNSPIPSTISGSGAQPFNGSIDEVMIVKRALTANEVKQIYYSNLHKYELYKWKLNMNHSGFLDSEVGIPHKFRVEITDGEGRIASTGTRSVNVNIPFLIRDISISRIQRIVEAGVRNVLFNVVVWNGKGSGVTGIDVNSQFAFTGPSGKLRPATPISCTRRAGDVAFRTYNCSIGIQYYDEPGLWNANVNAIDNGGGGGVAPLSDSREFVLLSTRAIIHSTGGIRWSSLDATSEDVYAVDAGTSALPSITLTNIGNDPILLNQVSMKAHDLLRDGGSDEFQATYFYTKTDSSAPPNPIVECMAAETGENVQQMENATSKIITSASVPVYTGAVGSNVEELYVCIDQVPGILPAGTYKANSANGRSWELTFPDFDPGIPASADRFFIRNSTGDTVAWLGSNGDIALKGSCSVSADCAAPTDSFIILNSAGDTVAYISPTGVMCIENGGVSGIGVDCNDYDLQASCNPTTDAVLIQQGGVNTGYIDFTGRLCLVGQLYENQATL